MAPLRLLPGPTSRPLPPCPHRAAPWEGDLPHGSGTYTFANMDKYNGDFAGGMKDGVGKCPPPLPLLWVTGGLTLWPSWRYIFRNRDSYEGDWRTDLMDGFGIFKWMTGRRVGDVYIGEWKAGVRAGKASLPPLLLTHAPMQGPAWGLTRGLAGGVHVCLRGQV
jgi:hypothetical protein